MKRIVFGTFGTLSAVALLFSYKTSLEVVAPAAAAQPTSGSATAAAKAAPTPSTTPNQGTTPSQSSTAGAAATSGTTGSAAGTATTSTGPQDGTFTGSAVDTRYGPVQVAVTISGGKITDVQVPQYPTQSRRDQEINSQAVPLLVSETTAAQSTQIQMVSGATYTSDAYVQSLQSALDQAGAK